MPICCGMSEEGDFELAERKEGIGELVDRRNLQAGIKFLGQEKNGIV